MKMENNAPFDFTETLNALTIQRPQFLLYQDADFIEKLKLFFTFIQQDIFNLFYMHRLYQYDLSTFYHSVDVAFLSVAFSKIFQTENPKEFCEGSLVHDIGKLFIPLSILQKTDVLTEKERKIMQHHTVYGYTYLFEQKGEYISRLALHHHENPSGLGYPDHLEGEEMKFDYFVLRLMDEFSALTLNRCYRSSLSSETAIQIILSNIKDSLSDSETKRLETILSTLLTEEEEKHDSLLKLLSSNEKIIIPYCVDKQKLLVPSFIDTNL